MSHFSVMVIGDDVEKQLAPFHEFECTGTDDEYVQNVDVTDECRENGLDWYGLEESLVTDESSVDLEGQHKYGYAVVDAEGHLIKAVNRTNPNKKWDYWTIGGRYSNMLRLMGSQPTEQVSVNVGPVTNDGDLYADQALWGQIDADGMRAEAAVEAAQNWDKAAEAKVKAGLSADATWDSWVSVCERHQENIDAARDEYHAQPAKSAVASAFSGFFFRGVDEFLTPCEEYIQQARDSALVFYALVKDRQWYAKGEMGWFGISSGDMSQSEWNKKVNELLDELPNDTLITIVDCHI